MTVFTKEMKCVSCEVEIYSFYIIWLSSKRVFQCAKSAAHLLWECHAIDVNIMEIPS